jgi:nicotinamide-nucleotide amidase
VQLELHHNLLEMLVKFFEKRGVPMAEINKRQAYIPAGAEPLENPLGTAPGIFVRHKGKIIAVMPGVPSEMKRMFEDSVLPQLREFAGGQIILVRKQLHRQLWRYYPAYYCLGKGFIAGAADG